MAEGGQCLEIGRPVALVDEARLQRFQRQMAADHGICLTFIAIPFRRSEQMMLQGKLDGDLLRTAIWAEMYAREVVAVPTPAFRSAVIAISPKASAVKITALLDLKAYRLLYPSGFRWAEQVVLELDMSAMQIPSVGRYLTTLRAGEADVGLLEKSVLPFLGDVSDMTIQEVEKLDYFIVLQRRHAGLVNAFDAALEKTGPFLLQE